MRKYLAFLLAAVLLLSLCACGKAEDTPAAESIKIMSLKGPTSMGLVNLYRQNENGESRNRYEASIVTAADEITGALAMGNTDIATLPANAAATLFNKKGGGFSVVAVNTLGVLNLVENGDTIRSIEDLAGKTVVLTGKGTTPEYALRHLLAACGIEDTVTLEFKSEAAEVVAFLAEDRAAVGLLPQPFVTTALMQNESLRIALDLTEEWKKVSPDSSLITGVTVVRTEFLEKYPEQIGIFLEEYAASVQAAGDDPEGTAQLIEEYGIVPKAAVALKALPGCNVVCITGKEMKEALQGYLQTLFDSAPETVGGMMPSDDFYYLP